MKILFSILINAFILFVIAYFLQAYPDGTGVVIADGSISYNDFEAIKTYLLGGILLGLMNLTIKPILKILSLPLFFVFLSFVSLIVNGIILYLFDFILNNILIIDGVGYKINGMVEFAIAVVIFTILNIIYSILFFKK